MPFFFFQSLFVEALGCSCAFQRVTLRAHALWPSWRSQLSFGGPQVATQAATAKHPRNLYFPLSPSPSFWSFFPCIIFLQPAPVSFFLITGTAHTTTFCFFFRTPFFPDSVRNLSVISQLILKRSMHGENKNVWAHVNRKHVHVSSTQSHSLTN